MKPKPKTLVLQTGGGIWPHTATDAAFVRRLKEQGHSVAVLACDGFVKGLCPVRLSRKRERVDLARNSELDCKDCKFASSLMASPINATRTQMYWFSRFIPDSARKFAKDKSESLQKNFNINTEVEGFPVLRLAAYEVALKYKSLDEAIHGRGSSEYWDAVETCILTICAAREFFASQGPFIQVLIRAPQYATNAVFARVALAEGLRVLQYDGSNNITEDYTHVTLWDWGILGGDNPVKAHYQKNSPAPNSSERKRIQKHLRALRKGTSHKVYSSPKSSVSLKQELEEFQDRPTALLATSSTDEIVAAVECLANTRTYPGTVFANQLDWVKATVAWFKDHPSYSLIVRIHPREFPNRRDSVLSQSGEGLQNLLQKLPPNVFLDHPREKRSIYDWFEIIDCVITGWSSAGLEAASAGIPIVIYDKNLPGYPAALGLSGESESEYFKNIDAVLSGANTITHAEDLSMRWLKLLMIDGTAKIGGAFLAGNRSLLPRFVSLCLSGLERYLYRIWLPFDLVRSRLFDRRDHTHAVVTVMGRDSLFGWNRQGRDIPG